MTRAVAVDLDGALGDTHAIWRDWLESASSVLGIDPAALPGDRVAAAAELDTAGAGNWRVLLERFAEDRAAVYLRPHADATAALRRLEARGVRVGVFTDAPDELARVALAQLGARRRVVALESGPGALERLCEQLGGKPVVVRTRPDLVSHAAPAA